MKYDLQTREEICAILRPYILCKYGNELVGKTYKEKEEGTNSDLSLERKITKSQIKNFVKKNYSYMEIWKIQLNMKLGKSF